MASGKKTDASFEEALTRSLRPLRGPLVASAIGALAIVAAVLLLLVWRQYEDTKEETAADLRSRAILAATVFDTYFAGQLTALSAIAASPTVVAGDPEAMADYFARFRPGRGSTFTAGVGWIDLNGRQRATSDARGPIEASLADRTYFSQVIETKKPFVSEAIVARATERRLVVMSVPTRDERGRLTGVLAGGIVLPRSRDNARALGLGYAGLEIIDRMGQQITRRDLAQPDNADLVEQLKKMKEGVLVDTRGLDGSDGRVVAYASSAAPGWTTVLDQPTSTVFAAARRTLLRETLLVSSAAAIVLALIAWGLHRARRNDRAGRAQVSRWAELTRALNDTVETEAIRPLLARALAKEFPDSSVVVAFHDVGDLTPETAPTVAHGRRSSLTAVDEGVAQWIAEVIGSSRSPVAIETQSEVRARADAVPVPERVSSVYAFSLLDETRQPVGAVGLLFTVEHALADHELALAQAHVDQVAHALARVRRHEQEHDVAVLLQESLLPDELPETEGVEVAAYYRAGVANTTVGGDWYDVVRRSDGIMHLTVGDVAGRGIAAAVSMGELRHAFRAYALDHASPAEVVRSLARHVPHDGMATMACVTYDPYTHELAYASAGHLPPLLVDPTAGVVTRLEPVRGGPLGWLSFSGPEEKRTTASPGVTLALYTDGLVERRGTDLDGRIDRLGDTILETLASGRVDAVDAVVSRMVDSRVEDDLALLLVQLRETPSVVRIELPAEPGLLLELRRRVRTWLAHRGVVQRPREAAVLALSEACNNAIEHAYRNEPGMIRMTLEHAGDTLTIRVADRGSWRQPLDDTTRGRGIVLMRGLMDVTEIVQKPNGTEVLLVQQL